MANQIKSKNKNIRVNNFLAFDYSFLKKIRLWVYVEYSHEIYYKKIMEKSILILSLFAILAILVLTAYFASKGYPVKIGTPILYAEIN